MLGGKRLYQAKKIAKRLFFHYHYKTPEEARHDPAFRDVDAILGSYRKTKVFCSDPWCCGNPRRGANGVSHKTLRERRLWPDYELEEALDQAQEVFFE